MAYIKNPVQAVSYSAFRPSPPKQLISKIIEFIKEEIPDPLGCALDVGCGSGQSTEILAPYFQQVIGVDNCKEQLLQTQHNSKSANVTYRLGSAEKLEEADGSVDLVTAGMAIHWFDLKQFCAEVDRVLRPNGVLAVYGYNLPLPTADKMSLTDIVQAMFKGGPLYQFVPDESKLAYFDSYTGNQFTKFPFSNQPTYRFEFEKKIENASLADLVGYVTTTSAFQNYIIRHGESEASKLLSHFKTQLAEKLSGSSSLEGVALDIVFPYFLLLSRKHFTGDETRAKN